MHNKHNNRKFRDNISTLFNFGQQVRLYMTYAESGLAALELKRLKFLILLSSTEFRRVSKECSHNCFQEGDNVR